MHTYNLGQLVAYKNNQLIAFNKPPNLLTQPNATPEKALINLGEIYCKARLHLIHRLDRPASGLVLFAKNKKALATLNKQFQTQSIQKIYLAAVKKKPQKTTDTLIHYLKKHSTQHRAIPYPTQLPSTKKAILHYQLLGSIQTYHLLKINIQSGRFHQIRAQLSAIGSPIKGDTKYGFKRSNKDHSIHLHAWQLNFTHPISGKQENIQAPPPQDDPVWQAFQPYYQPEI